MLRALDRQRGRTCYAFTSLDDLDIPAVLSMLNTAWQADYRDQERLALDEPFLRNVLGTSGWVGVLACDEEARPLGFLIGQERILYCRQRPLRAAYNTLYTVAASHRGEGLGGWLIQNINQLLFDTYQTEVIFLAFHPNHAGFPAVQRTVGRLSGWGMQVLHTAPLWGRRLDREAIPPLSAPLCVCRVVAVPGAPTLTPLALDTFSCPTTLPSLENLAERLGKAYQVTFGPQASFAARYLHPKALHAGTLWYDFGAAVCCISFDQVALLRNAQRLGVVGRVQTVYAQNCTPQHLHQALQHLCGVFQDQGCYAMGVLDQGVIPPTVLDALAFRPLDDARVFAVRGLATTLQAFDGVQPPFCFDL